MRFRPLSHLSQAVIIIMTCLIIYLAAFLAAGFLAAGFLSAVATALSAAGLRVVIERRACIGFGAALVGFASDVDSEATALTSSTALTSVGVIAVSVASAFTIGVLCATRGRFGPRELCAVLSEFLSVFAALFGATASAGLFLVFSRSFCYLLCKICNNACYSTR